MATLSPRGRFWTTAGVAGLSLWASGAPSALYPHYAAVWELPAVATTAVFAIYPFVLVPVLILFGNLSDYVGRRASMLAGIAVIIVGAVLLALAPNVGWVFVGRGLTAVGVGLSLSPATAAMVDAGGAERASTTTTASTAGGLALATLVSGAALQFLPDPLHLSYWILVVLALVLSVAVWFLPRHTAEEARGRWRPAPLAVPAGLRRGFAAAALGVSGAYSLGAIVLALGAQTATQLVRSGSDLVNGSLIAVSAVAIGASAIAFRRIPARRAIAIGAAAAVGGVLLLAASGLTQSLVVFLLASLVGGAGYSLLFAGGLGVVTAAAPVAHRAGLLSSVYTVAYLAQAAVALGLGAVATADGLQIALEIGTLVLLVIGGTAAVVALLPRSRPRPAAEGARA